MSSDEAAVDLSVLLLPVTGKLLVVPSVMVAEIIKRRELREPEESSHGFLGTFPWHNGRVPALSFETLNNEGIVTDVGGGSRLVIMNTLADPDRRRNYAILTQGVPHLMRLTPGDVTAMANAIIGPAERMRVQVHGQLGSIPNLDYIERQLPKAQ